MENKAPIDQNFSVRPQFYIPPKKDPVSTAKDALSKLRVRGIFSGFLILALAIAIPFTVFVTQKQQEIRQRASAPTPTIGLPIITVPASPSGRLTPSVTGNNMGANSALDFQTFSDCFGSKFHTADCTNHLNYKRADFNGDGVVDSTDYSLFLKSLK